MMDRRALRTAAIARRARRQRQRRQAARVTVAIAATPMLVGAQILPPPHRVPADFAQRAPAPLSAPLPPMRFAALPPLPPLGSALDDPPLPTLAALRPVPPAFHGERMRPQAFAAALECLTSAVYYEAASEGDAGQLAVAQVVLNRVRHPAFPRSVCGVVFQGWTRSTGCQFTFACDGSLARAPSRSGWGRARTIAASALTGTVAADIGYATHYHTHAVAPNWRLTLTRQTTLGAHIFYRWSGKAGEAPAFVNAPSGQEQSPLAEARMAALKPAMPEVAITAADAAAAPSVAPAEPGQLSFRPLALETAPALDDAATGGADAGAPQTFQPLARS